MYFKAFQERPEAIISGYRTGFLVISLVSSKIDLDKSKMSSIEYLSVFFVII